MKMPKFNKFLVRQAIRKVGLVGFVKAYQEMIYAYDVDNGKNYPTTEAELDEILKDVPELSKVKEQLISITKEARVKAGLPA